MVQEKPTLDDGRNEAHEEIAAFAALVHSSSGGEDSDDDESSSLVMLPEYEPSVLRAGAGKPCNDPGEEGDCDGRSASNHTRQMSSLSLVSCECDDGSEGEEYHDRSVRHHFRLLLARIKANPYLTFSTIFMGALTVCLWTNERFRFIARSKRSSNVDGSNSSSRKKKGKNHIAFYPAFPANALLGISIRKKVPKLGSVDPPYDPESDFQYNRAGRTRTLIYWEEVVEAIEETQSMLDGNSSLQSNELVDLWTNMTNWGPCYPRALPAENSKHRMLRVNKVKKKNDSTTRNWTKIVLSNSDRIMDEKSIVYPTYKKSHYSQLSLEESLRGLCRPGFLIIGQGKCGTSSLYHYLTGHPRILPAKEKQIHYFRYHKSKPLSWYYSHFPAIESFLGRGALMTGEASPGYMPYPSVVESVAKRFSPNWRPGSGEDGIQAWKEHVRSLPKIIAIVRDPVKRAISSYKYNYVEPALKKLRAGRGISASGERIPGKQSEGYYRKNHLFTFEELAYAELATLRTCLAPGGRGERYSYKKNGKKSFFYESIQRRNKTTALINLDEACYLTTKSKSVPGAQWIDLAKEHPTKVLQLPNLQLTQSVIGRGVYALPLEWWYEVFSNAAANNEDRIHVVCTEDMADNPGNTMGDITEFLGLPEFDFHNVTSVGRYNVGGHRGYDTLTKSRDEDNEDNQSLEKAGTLSKHDSPVKVEFAGGLAAISDALMNDLNHFYRPYNERLFRLIGKRCQWQ